MEWSSPLSAEVWICPWMGLFWARFCYCEHPHWIPTRCLGGGDALWIVTCRVFFTWLSEMPFLSLKCSMFAYKAVATCSPVMFYAQLKFLVFMNIGLWNLKEEERCRGRRQFFCCWCFSSPEISAGLGIWEMVFNPVSFGLLSIRKLAFLLL